MIAIETRFQGIDSAQLAGGDELLQGEEIAVPAAVLIGREHQFSGARELNQLPGLVAGGDEGLVDHDMLVRFQGLVRPAQNGWKAEC